MAEAKREMVKIEEKGNVLTFKINGTTIDLDVGALNKDIILQLAKFGARRKVTNAAAGKSTEEASVAMQRVADALKAGEWTVKSSVSVKDAIKAQVISMLKSLPKDVRKSVANSIKSKIEEAGITEEELRDILNS